MPLQAPNMPPEYSLSKCRLNRVSTSFPSGMISTACCALTWICCLITCVSVKLIELMCTSGETLNGMPITTQGSKSSLEYGLYVDIFESRWWHRGMDSTQYVQLYSQQLCMHRGLVFFHTSYSTIYCVTLSETLCFTRKSMSPLVMTGMKVRLCIIKY